MLDWGDIKVDGQYVGYEKNGATMRPIRDLAKARADARIGMVFQHFNLFDHLTALRERQRGAGPGLSRGPEEGARASRSACWPASAWAATPIICRTGSPAASSSVSPSPARSPSRRA